MPIKNKVAYDKLLEKSKNNNILEQQLQKIEKKYKVKINLNDIVGISNINPRFKKIFEKYYYHNNTFCNYLKKHNKMFKFCTTKKRKLRDYCLNLKRPFYGRCYIGIEEFIYPIFLDEKLIGYICVGEFCEDIEQTKKIVNRYAKKYELDSIKLNQKLKSIVKKIDFSITELSDDLRIVSEYISIEYRCYVQNNIINGQYNQNEIEIKNFYVKNTVKFINDNYNKNINLDMIAAHTYCNPSYLSHIFKKQLSCSIVDYINDVRIEKSKSLLNVTNLSITDVALKVGFNNSSYFSKVFKQKMNKSPLQYRNE